MIKKFTGPIQIFFFIFSGVPKKIVKLGFAEREYCLLFIEFTYLQLLMEGSSNGTVPVVVIRKRWL